jgi:hypothetical protein
MYGPESKRKSSGSNGLRPHMAARADAGALDARTIRRALRSMPVRVPPADLDLRLRVTASREASRRRLSANGRVSFWQERVRMWFADLMRPLALPTAGGFVSAVILFGLLAPNLAVRDVSAQTADIPTSLYTEASVKSSLPLGYDGAEMLVDVTVDEEGRMVEYFLPEDVPVKSTPELRRNIENHLLTMVFTPATTFGQPTASRLKIWLRNSRIDVRG